MGDLAKRLRTRGSQAAGLPGKSRKGKRVVLESSRRTWSRRFIELAGSARGFPYPAEPLRRA